jgi:cell wall-associated NlpC family hydrolase
MMRNLIWTLALACLTTACATTGAVPRPFPVPGGASQAPPDPSATPPSPAPPPSAPASPGVHEAPAAFPGAPARSGSSTSDGSEASRLDSYALVGTALALRGAPYRNGGSDPQGFDCSGFTQYVFSRYGIALPRDVRAQYRFGKSIEPNEILPGDLVFFTTTNPDVSHVAIAIGGDGFVHAPSSLGVVRVEHLSGSYWSQRYVGARRMN